MLKACCPGFSARLMPVIVVALFMGALFAGCNDSAKQASQADSSVARPQLTKQALLPANAPTGASASQQPPVTPVANTDSRKQASPPPSQQSLSIPEGARWTIFCFPVNGLGHVQGATQARDDLKGKTGRSDWYVIHRQETSNIYFGFYKSVEPNETQNAAEVQRAHRDLQWVRDVKSADGNKPFERCLFVALDSPDPTAPPEWDLFNVDRNMNPQDDKRAFWSLQIMAFRSHQLRKEAAVQAVADLRAKGVEAYYFHGDVVSSVTVGKWPYHAVKEQNRTDKFKDVAGSDPGTPMAVTNFPLPDNLSARPIDGKRAVSVAPKLEIQDPDMLQMMKRFPTHAVNYEIGIQTGDSGEQREDPSFLVEIPRGKGNGRFDSVDSAPVTADTGTDWGTPRGPSMITPPEPRNYRGATGQPPIRQ